MHSNYSDYCKDFSLFDELRKFAQIHLVDEIDWMQYNADLLRYSKMHCFNFLNLLKNCKYYDFDYAIHLDNDVLIKGDFIEPLLQENSDLIFEYFDGTNTIRRVASEMDGLIQFAPKIAAWNIIFSKKLIMKIIEQPESIFPDKIIDTKFISYYKTFFPEIDESIPLMFDTFSKLLYFCTHIWKDIKITSNMNFSDFIHHFFFSSFNYGVQVCRNSKGVKSAEDIWKQSFPNGFDEFKKTY